MANPRMRCIKPDTDQLRAKCRPYCTTEGDSVKIRDFTRTELIALVILAMIVLCLWLRVDSLEQQLSAIPESPITETERIDHVFESFKDLIITLKEMEQR